MSTVLQIDDYPKLREFGPMVTLYRATNKINGKSYIGVTNKKLRDRRSQHHYNMRNHSNLKFHRALRKHGIEKFEWETLWNCYTYADALEEERRLIRMLVPEYNITKGGGGVYGLKFSDESKKKMSLAKKGKPSLKKGVPLSEEMKFRISQTLIRKNRSGEIKSDPSKALAKRRMKIICVTDGKEFSSQTEAENFYGISSGLISRSIALGVHTHGILFKKDEK